MQKHHFEKIKRSREHFRIERTCVQCFEAILEGIPYDSRSVFAAVAISLPF